MLSDSLVIAASTGSDRDEIFAVERDAFGREAEARLALALMDAPIETISIVARCGGHVVGHVLLSEIAGPVHAMALAPLAVDPSHREMLIGSRLVAEAITRARQAGYGAIFVLGDNLYYERFGFSSELADPFEIEWQGPHFMALELEPGALKRKRGRLDYPQAFFAAA